MSRLEFLNFVCVRCGYDIVQVGMVEIGFSNRDGDIGGSEIGI